ncbi:MAG: hypothetical protein NZ954_06500 [Thermofilaceae archaeon]|nr:hypothetical protein [Thermofilaceae archaeon]MDW8003755.1 RNA-binding domain-containing protein [Thermofilaceae archaeon]
MPDPVLSVEISVFCHATEELDKVKQAILRILPEDLRSIYEGKLNVNMLEGYYGNPVFSLKLRIDERTHASTVVKWMLEHLNLDDIQMLSNELEKRLDSSGNLYLRFDKQYAFLGKIKIYEGDDVIKVKVKFSQQARRGILEKGLKAIR